MEINHCLAHNCLTRMEIVCPEWATRGFLFFAKLLMPKACSAAKKKGGEGGQILHPGVDEIVFMKYKIHALYTCNSVVSEQQQYRWNARCKPHWLISYVIQGNCTCSATNAAVELDKWFWKCSITHSITYLAKVCLQEFLVLIDGSQAQSSGECLHPGW